MRKTRIGQTLSIVAVGALGTLVTGCAVTDPSPSMVASGRSDAEVAQTYTISSDENMRAIIDDLERTFYTDRPSRLTPMPVPH